MKPTMPRVFKVGNGLFERLVHGLGMDAAISRTMLSEALASVGSSPIEATRADVERSLPVIERRLRALLADRLAAQRIRKLHEMLHA